MSLIVAKAPMRVPFAGGLTDLPESIEMFPGATVSCTIDQYLYCSVKENRGGYFRLRYQDTFEKVSEIGHIKNDVVREALRLVGVVDGGVDVYIAADLPPESGLGSSGALAVALISALRRFQGLDTSARQALELANTLEVRILEGSGFHDPSICALGGLRRLDYSSDGIHDRVVLRAEDPLFSEFDSSLLFFYGGRHSRSKPSLDLLRANISAGADQLQAMVELVADFEVAVQGADVGGMARVIRDHQALKRALPGAFDDDYVDHVVSLADSVGAAAQLPGGKIGAFILVCCPDGNVDEVRKTFAEFTEAEISLVSAGPVVIEV